MATSGKAINLSPISPAMQGAIRQVIDQVNRMSVAQAVNDLCRTYAIRPAGDHLMVAVFRAVRVTIQVHYRKPLERDEITETTISFLPYVCNR